MSKAKLNKLWKWSHTDLNFRLLLLPMLATLVSANSGLQALTQGQNWKLHTLEICLPGLAGSSCQILAEPFLCFRNSPIRLHFGHLTTQ